MAWDSARQGTGEAVPERFAYHAWQDPIRTPMIRDITMIISVLVSVVSVGFGLYKNIEAGNARGYAYEQAYRVLNVVQQANISTAAKAAITNDALETFGTPPPVIELSRSRADVGESEPCTDDVRVSW